MFKKIIPFLILLILSTACASKHENKATSTPKPLAVGDSVLGRWGGDAYYEGKIVSIEGKSAKVNWTEVPSPSSVEVVDIYH